MEKSNPSIFIYAHLDDAARRLLASTLPTPGVIYADKFAGPALRETQLAQFRQSEICFGNVPAEWLPQAVRTRWMQLESVGFEYYQHVSGLPSGLTITNLRGLFDRPTAETALAGLLGLYRGLNEMVPAQRAARWICLELRPRLRMLHGKRVVILGAGSIGRKLRRLLLAFDCHVQNFARTADDAELRTLEDLDRALPTADVVACCLPNTEHTRGLFDRRRFSLLNQGAIFVNVGRGLVVDESALVDVLQRQQIGGAVIDVTHEEPLPSHHPLWSCPHTILTQHTGGGYDEELLDKARSFLANLARFQRGDSLANVVDLKRGY